MAARFKVVVRLLPIVDYRVDRHAQPMAQMKCLRCQYDNRFGARFCGECAAPLALICPNCRNSVVPGAKFCSQCAHPVGLEGEYRTEKRFLSPEHYTPKHLADRILTSKDDLEGERKQVTVLFADMWDLSA